MSKEFDYMFHPRSIAIAGASPDPTKWMKQYFLLALLAFEFDGDIYPVNPGARETAGLKAYSSIGDIPGLVDHVYSVLPARFTPKLMEDCVAKGVKAVTLFTAGFSETGSDDGIKLEAEVARIAREGGVRIIGPNCMGIYCPNSRLSYEAYFPKEGGPVGFVSQSGANSYDLIPMGAARGINFSKVISYGNACDLNETDFLEYLAGDPETRIISMYIEGTKDGRRFNKALGEAAKTKPVIIIKGGHTGAGGRAVVTHTGALAGSNIIWDVLCKQTGAIRVYSIDELADVVLAFLFIPKLNGRNIGIITFGGGPSVLSADDCESFGLTVPSLPPVIRDELNGLIGESGSSTINPVESMATAMPEVFPQVIRAVARCEDIDLMLVVIRVSAILNIPGQNGLSAELNKALIRAGSASNKTICVVLQSASSVEESKVAAMLQRELVEAGFPVYSTIARAANAISKCFDYYRKQAK